MTLRDAVTTAHNTVGQPARQLAETSANSNRPTTERLHAFRQIIDLEVGDTWLRRARSLERDYDRSRLYLKFEGDNPTGTQKDRIAFAHLADAIEKGYGTVAVASCGNYGVATALAAKLAGIECRVYIPANYHTKRLAEMEVLGATLLRPPGSYEEVVEHSRAEAERNGWYDANPGGETNAELQIEAYAPIAHEIISQLDGNVPEVVAVPVSNGTLLAGIYRGFQQALPDRRPPRLLAASSTRKNPIVVSWSRKLKQCTDLDPAKLRETLVNEPLINWHSFDGQAALDAVYATNGGAAQCSDEKLRRASAYLNKREALGVLPASCASLVALLETEGLEQALTVAVLTGKR